MGLPGLEPGSRQKSSWLTPWTSGGIAVVGRLDSNQGPTVYSEVGSGVTGLVQSGSVEQGPGTAPLA